MKKTLRKPLSFLVKLQFLRGNNDWQIHLRHTILQVDIKHLLESIMTAIGKINDSRLDNKGLKLYMLLKNYFGKF